MHYKATDTHNYLHHTSLHPDHCKQAIPYSQFLRLRRISSDNDDFAARATEMKAFFQARGYPEALLNGDPCKISTVSRNQVLRPPAERDYIFPDKIYFLQEPRKSAAAVALLQN